jgi:uncharacterized repeat protein (TIGR01451 family)
LNSASITATTPLTGATDTTLTTPVTTSADLSLVLASTPTSIAGTTAVVTATVTNAGPSDAAGAVVTLTLPAGHNADSASLPGWLVRPRQRRRHGDADDDERIGAERDRYAAGDGGHCLRRDAGHEPGIPGRGRQQHK